MFMQLRGECMIKVFIFVQRLSRGTVQYFKLPQLHKHNRYGQLVAAFKTSFYIWYQTISCFAINVGHKLGFPFAVTWEAANFFE